MERLVALAPTPRKETPCEEGFAYKLLERRKVLKPGTWRRTSSTARLPDKSICSSEMEKRLAGTAGMRSCAVDFTSMR